jgi:hypothetical protein
MDLRAALSAESDFNSEIVDPLVTEAPVGEPLGRLPAHVRDRIMVDVIHDGATIPAPFLVDGDGRPIAPEEFRREYELDRDWGAGLVASRLAGALGLSGWYNVRIARVLMDFGRLPGTTTHGQADYQSRFAINYPFSRLLSYEQRRAVLEGCYDAVSAELERHIRRRVVKIAVHTYDRLNASGTLRPAVSLVTRSQAYQTASRLPTGLYDPLYPDLLAEFTADRVLTDRISLDLEKGGIPVAHNYPYLLPEGSVEVRSQVWFFFNYLRQRFEDEHPDTRDDLAFRMVWDLLLDTNLRSSRGEMLRSYLHLYRHAPPGQEALFRAARLAYDRVRAFLAQDDRRVVEDYRFWEDRPSSIGVEIRKDLVWEFDAEDRPVRPKPAAAHRVAEAIARAVLVYLNLDHPERAARDGLAPRQDSWPQAAAQG